MLARRLFLACASGLLLADAPLRPTLTPGDAAHDAVLALPGGGRFSCPALRAGLLVRMAFRAGPVLALRFGWDDGTATQDLLALISADGDVLAVERLVWRSGGASFVTRFAMRPDRAHLALERVAMLPGSPRRHESWTDYLRRDRDGLHDAPARPVLAGTLQAALSDERARLAEWTKSRPAAIPPPLLTALRNSPFGEGAAGN
jgi:hypothetical protein